MITYRWVYGVSIFVLLFSLALGVGILVKGDRGGLVWMQQALLWTGLLGMCVGMVLKSQDKRISNLEKHISKGENV